MLHMKMNKLQQIDSSSKSRNLHANAYFSTGILSSKTGKTKVAKMNKGASQIASEDHRPQVKARNNIIPLKKKNKLNEHAESNISVNMDLPFDQQSKQYK